LIRVKDGDFVSFQLFSNFPHFTQLKESQSLHGYRVIVTLYLAPQLLHISIPAFSEVHVLAILKFLF